MSLNCLRCQNLSRTGSEKEHIEGCGDHQKPHFKLHWPKVDKVGRSWSGNLVPRPSYDKIRNETMSGGGGGGGGGQRNTNPRSGPLRLESGPRLARSCGMRRDWSFEDLRQRMDENMTRGH